MPLFLILKGHFKELRVFYIVFMPKQLHKLLKRK